MNDVRTRLSGCFRAVFPHLSESAIHSASVESIEKWDSVAMVTLNSLVQEEFSLEIPLDDMEGLQSFSHFAEYLERRLAGK
jgi:acyl carrier protein